MATGASTADAAIILIDARHGVLTQTKRHAFIASLLKIRHLIVAVNKMDLLDYSEEKFRKIEEEFGSFTQQLNIPDVRFVPISAIEGENVTQTTGKRPGTKAIICFPSWKRWMPATAGISGISAFRYRQSYAPISISGGSPAPLLPAPSAGGTLS